MPQIFPRSANSAARLILVSLVVVFSFASTGAVLGIRSTFATQVGHPVDQPIPFSHAHHVGDDGIDCRYCHNSVENSSFAGLPATEVCMTCHSQLFTEAPLLQPLRDSLETGEPIRWNRVHDLGDFVYFNHSVHVNNGVACVSCHGQVDDMPLMWRENPMHMEWCLGCHRDPAPNLRPKSAVFDPAWRPPADVKALHAVLLREYDIDPARLTDCYVCHR